ELTDRTIRGYTVTGLLAGGAGHEQAQSDVDVAMRQLAQAYPQTNRNVAAEVLPFWQSPRGPQRLMATSLAILQVLMLLLLGAALGGAIAYWGTATLSAMPPLRVRGIPISFETHVDATSLLFTLALGLACGLMFGLAPALQLARLDPQLTLRAGASTPPRSRLRNTLM